MKPVEEVSALAEQRDTFWMLGQSQNKSFPSIMLFGYVCLLGHEAIVAFQTTAFHHTEIVDPSEHYYYPGLKRRSKQIAPVFRIKDAP